MLSEVIESRVEEIFTLVAAEVEKAGFEDKIPSGVVLTGGSSVMLGMVEIAEQILNLPARVGSPPSELGGLVDMVRNPLYATGVGLILYACHSHQEKSVQPHEKGHLWSHIAHSLKEWKKEFF